jgi:long-chain acyl-CoA synthetase
MDALSRYLARPWERHYAAGVSANTDIPQKSLPELFDEVCARFADRTAIIFYGRSLQYREVHEATERLAAGLSGLGLRKGDRLALYLLNSPQFVIAYFAALKCGAIITPISPVYTSHEVRFQIEDSGARGIVCQDILYEKVAKSGVALDFAVLTSVGEYLSPFKRLLGRGPLGRFFSSLDVASPAIPASPNVHSLQDLINARGEPPHVEIDPQTDLAVLPYTGGTTGRPKGVMLTHRNLIAAAVGAHSAFPSLEPGNEVVLAFLPFFHIYGQVAIMLSGLVRGHALVLFTNPDTEAILAAMERYRATIFYGVPTLFEYLKDHKDTSKVDWRRLKVLVSGADMLHESTMTEWSKRTGAEITEGYGLTEAAAVCHVNPMQRRKPGSFGCPVTNLLAAVIDPQTLDFVDPGSIGELVLAGPSVMQGYWKRAEENADAFLERDGRRWLRTGDIAKMDDEGYFHFYDRAKDLIKYKGYSIFAKDVEDVLYAHPQVKSAGVIGVDDPAVGQRIKAIVVLQSDARGKVGEDVLRNYCREHLAEYKVPHLIEFRGELPKTDVGKVSRRELRDE